MRIYTRTGDKGETALYGGQRVSKTSVRIEAIGQVDELNASIGLVITKLPEKEFKDLKDLLVKIQNDVFVCGGDLATPSESSPRLKRVQITIDSVKFLEEKIDFYNSNLPSINKFILPGGSELGALLHESRAICRRAERSVVYAMEHEEINQNCQIYLNRLSDLFFVLARFVNQKLGIEEHLWIS